jgi:hypothetical protein
MFYIASFNIFPFLKRNTILAYFPSLIRDCFLDTEEIENTIITAKVIFHFNPFPGEPGIRYCFNDGPLDSGCVEHWCFCWCLVHWEVVTDTMDQTVTFRVVCNAEQMRLEHMPSMVQPALLPLTITEDKNTDTWAVGKLDPSAAAHLAPHLFNTALPCNFPSIVICERLHSLTFIMCPVASIGCLSHLLIALKLQFTWIAGNCPQKILSPSEAWLLRTISEGPVETNVTLNSQCCHRPTASIIVAKAAWPWNTTQDT